MRAQQGHRRGFGAIRKLPSGRYQASYIGPDLVRHKAPTTYPTREDAEGWLYKQRGAVTGDDWTPPAVRK
ncbi:MAG: integrase, partial [Nocardioidaceae bacterium]|nr:integrase [Nocardioidaceae bacterium]